MFFFCKKLSANPKYPTKETEKMSKIIEVSEENRFLPNVSVDTSGHDGLFILTREKTGRIRFTDIIGNKEYIFPENYEYVMQIGVRGNYLLSKKENVHVLFVQSLNIYVEFPTYSFFPDVFYYGNGVFVIILENKYVHTFSLDDLEIISDNIYSTKTSTFNSLPIFRSKYWLSFFKSGYLAEKNTEEGILSVYDLSRIISGGSAGESIILSIKSDFPAKLDFGRDKVVGNIGIITTIWRKIKHNNIIEDDGVYIYTYFDYKRNKILLQETQSDTFTIFCTKNNRFYRINDGKLFDDHDKQLFPEIPGSLIKSLANSGSILIERHICGYRGDICLLIDLPAEKCIYISCQGITENKKTIGVIQLSKVFAFISMYDQYKRTIYNVIANDIFPENSDEFRYLPEECRKIAYLLLLMNKFGGLDCVLRSLPKEILCKISQHHAEIFGK